MKNRDRWLWLPLVLLVSGLALAQVVSLPATTGSAGLSFTSARLLTSGTAPTCSSTGTGAGPSCTLATGSTDAAGIATITPQAVTSALGTFTLTFTSATVYGANGTSCAANLKNNTGTWSTRATLIGSTAGNTTHVWLWDNNGVNLTATSTYDVEYVCLGR